MPIHVAYPGRHAPRRRSLRRRGGRFGRESRECYTSSPPTHRGRCEQNRGIYSVTARVSAVREESHYFGTGTIHYHCRAPSRSARKSFRLSSVSDETGGRGGAFRGLLSETKLAKPRRSGRVPGTPAVNSPSRSRGGKNATRPGRVSATRRGRDACPRRVFVDEQPSEMAPSAIGRRDFRRSRKGFEIP